MNQHILNEMTVLNNELVNAQRILVKQNAEISRLNDQLQLTNTELVQFSYVISHDLKEPLRMVTSFIELLRRKHGHALGEEGNVYLDFALDGGRRMQKMIEYLLELSRIGRENMNKELTDLNVLLTEVKQNIIKLTEDSRAKIIIETELPILPVYPGDIVRLLQNLLSNALKFRKKDVAPVIHISSTEEPHAWRFRIADNGIGIKKQKFDHIFEIFKRLHSNEEFEGAGIGLAICKKVALHHGGRIWVESEEGKGSAFYFTLSKTK